MELSTAADDQSAAVNICIEGWRYRRDSVNTCGVANTGALVIRTELMDCTWCLSMVLRSAVTVEEFEFEFEVRRSGDGVLPLVLLIVT